MLGTAHLALLRALDRMWVALRDTIAGGHGSLLDYFTTRLRLSRAIARVESLLAVQASLDADAQTLLLIDKAARRARVGAARHLRKLGVELGASRAPGVRDDISGLLGRGGETLVEPFVGDEGSAEIVDVAAGRRAARAESTTCLRSSPTTTVARDRWREELPFADLARLRAAAEPHAKRDRPLGSLRGRRAGRGDLGTDRQVRPSSTAIAPWGAEFHRPRGPRPTGMNRPFQAGGEAIVPALGAGA